MTLLQAVRAAGKTGTTVGELARLLGRDQWSVWRSVERIRRLGKAHVRGDRVKAACDSERLSKDCLSDYYLDKPGAHRRQPSGTDRWGAELAELREMQAGLRADRSRLTPAEREELAMADRAVEVALHCCEEDRRYRYQLPELLQATAQCIEKARSCLARVVGSQCEP